MEPARPILWNVPHASEILLYVLIPLVLGAFLAGTIWRIRKWFLGRPEPGAVSPGRQLLQALAPRRWAHLAKTVFFQSRLSTDPFSIVMHQAIFWGMVVLFLGTALATIDQDVANLLFDTQVLRGWFYRWFELALDLFGVVLLVGLAMAAYRRYVVRPARLVPTRSGISLLDSFPLLGTLALIAVTGFLIEGLRLAEGFHLDQQASAGSPAAREEFAEHFRHLGAERRQAELARIGRGEPFFPAGPWAPVGYGLARLLAPLPLGAVRGLHQAAWWIHALAAFALIVAIPFTKAFHLLASPANLLLRGEGPPGRLEVAAESGVDTVRDLTWRQLLQVEACTWCGKCREVCPAHQGGTPLAPCGIVQAVDAELLRTPFRAVNGTPSLHGTRIRPEELWSCSACGACDEICPVLIEHPRLIADLRRRLVDRGEVEEGLQDALVNFQRYGNSFGQSPRKRADWTKTLGFTPKDARKEEVEYLWFVGDYASYDVRAQEVTRTVARLLRAAGVDFGLLFEKEQNAGNDVRRAGEEGLFSLLREKNLKELASARFRKLLTTDPHTYNTLKNEYPLAETDGAHASAGERRLAGKPVLHYTELLDELLRVGALRPQRPLDLAATYHDPCYLGRFNGVYAAPRRVLHAVGVALVEMPRHGPHSFCCGAGGGRIWMKDIPAQTERPAESRVREALALGVDCLVVACPKDLAMFQDAIKTVGAEKRLRVADLAELVFEATNLSSEPSTLVGTSHDRTG